jgi:hypothetical protein
VLLLVMPVNIKLSGAVRKSCNRYRPNHDNDPEWIFGLQR